MVLRYSADMEAEATMIENAVTETLEEGFRTTDIARGNIAGQRTVTTEEMGALILDKVNGELKRARNLSSTTQP